MFCLTTGIYECKTALHKDKQKDIAERETNMEMMEAIWDVISRQSLWTVVQSPVKSGDRQFKMAIASSKWRSPVQNGDHQFKEANGQLKVAIAGSKWWFLFKQK